MHGVLLSVALGSSVTAWHYAANASDASYTAPLLDDAPGLFDAALGRGHALSELKLLKRTFMFVGEKYVEPDRIDPDEMFRQAIEAVEREVPEVLFRGEPEGRLLHLAVGSYATAFEIPAMATLDQVEDQLARVAEVLEQHLGDEVELAQVEYAMINGALSTLDPHSLLMEPRIAEDMDVDNAGEFGGLGIQIIIPPDTRRLTIDHPLQDTPAYRAGLKSDDRILRIDGQSTINIDLEEAVSLLRGPVGKPVTITVERDTWDKPRDIEIVRAVIQINPVEGELLPGGIGYIKIKNFHANVAKELDDVLARFKRENLGKINGLVLDLRHNPGGYLNQAVAVSDKFLSAGPIVATVESGNRNRDEMTATRPNTEPDYPIAVLVNANSASASEIVAGALKAQGRAVVIGERTFGKGSVQHLYPNQDDSKLKLTVAKYLTPGDRSIQSVGISPDVALEPSLVDSRVDEDTGETDPVVSLHWRERVGREADLDHHLDQMGLSEERPAYTIRYLRQLEDEENTSDDEDLSDDWEVQFARDLLLSAPGHRRAEVLAAAGPAVVRHTEAEVERIRLAFEEQGVDWSTGSQPDEPSLHVELDLGDDGVLRAGGDHEEVVWLRVTNTGDEPVHQLMGMSSSSVEWLDEQEFYFGRIDPGETRSWPRRVRLPEGYRDEVAKVQLDLTAGQDDMGSEELLVRTVGQPLGKIDYTLTLSDHDVEGVVGNGDGIAQVGETVALTLSLTNSGEGATREAFASLKNRSGKDLDLLVGTLEVGVVEPGETVAHSFLFEVRGERDGDAGPVLEAELSVGDNALYDYAGVMRAGFYETFAQTEDVVVPLGRAMDPIVRASPQIELTRSPQLLVSSGPAVLSGMVRDEQAVRDVIVYHAAHTERAAGVELPVNGMERVQEKVFYEGGDEGVTALPFTVEVELGPGQNSFVVLARDADGLSSIRSVQVWYDETGEERLAAADLPLEGGGGQRTAVE